MNEIKHQRSETLYYKAQHLGSRIPKDEEEELLSLGEPNWICKYAIDIIKDRWPEAEGVISKDSSFACNYAAVILKSRFYKAEDLIKKDPEFAYFYAKDVINNRWAEAEPYISEDAYFSYKYALSILKDRFLLAEEKSLEKNIELLFYYAQNIMRGRLPERLHNKMITNALEFPKDQFVIKYFNFIK